MGRKSREKKERRKVSHETPKDAFKELATILINDEGKVKIAKNPNQSGIGLFTIMSSLVTDFLGQMREAEQQQTAEEITKSKSGIVLPGQP